MFVSKNKVYLLGGRNTSSWVSLVYTCDINSDGTMGTCTTGTSLPGNISGSQLIITKNRVYMLGGSSASGVYASTVYTATISDGLNDYSTYYNGDILPIEQFVTVAKFKLPDASFMNDGLNYFIKY